MDSDHHKIEPGPPKKGFWGFIAGMFPKRPEVLDPSSPTGNTPAEDKTSQLNPSEFQADEPSQTPSEDAVETTATETEAKLPQTDEESAPNDDDETSPPTIPTPEDVKAPTTEENDGKPPTLTS
jgi:hypothetical protein